MDLWHSLLHQISKLITLELARIKCLFRHSKWLSRNVQQHKCSGFATPVKQRFHCRRIWNFLSNFFDPRWHRTKAMKFANSKASSICNRPHKLEVSVSIQPLVLAVGYSKSNFFDSYFEANCKRKLYHTAELYWYTTAFYQTFVWKRWSLMADRESSRQSLDWFLVRKNSFFHSSQRESIGWMGQNPSSSWCLL